MSVNNEQHDAILQRIAHRVMIERGLLPNFSAEALAELKRIEGPATVEDDGVRDLRGLLWASIDNDDSRDLDQLTAAEGLEKGKAGIRVAVADVDALVRDGSAIDDHARHNTTSVYTAAEIFSMLPEKLSTDFTSLNPHEERLAIVVEMVIGPDGSIEDSDVCRARVCNRAKLAYNSVAAWLDGSGAIPEAVNSADGLAENLRLQDRVAQSMKELRHAHGALSLETIEARPVFDGGAIRDLAVEEKNRAKSIIEDFMIGANGVVARYLSARGFPSIRRVVRTPRRWERIVEVADDEGFSLPRRPDPTALQVFLVEQQAADPLRFPDLSLSIIRLLGSGEYVADRPGGGAPGHFGLAVQDYAHSTAPNRRYPDLITQRLLKAAIAGHSSPYSMDELDALASHCTEAEDAANKVERHLGKSAAALLLESRSGEEFEALVTGASSKGTWVRILDPPTEGRLAPGLAGVDVGERLRVRLVSADVERGYIDFEKAGRSRSG
jgi:exoribonuclease-2